MGRWLNTNPDRLLWSDPEADDPIRVICRKISEKESFILCNPKYGADLIRRYPEDTPRV